MSYFKRINETIYGDEIDGLTTISSKHKPYYEEPYTDDSIYYKAQRRNYIENVNSWLDEPLDSQTEYDKKYNLVTKDEYSKNIIYETNQKTNINDTVRHKTVVKQMFDRMNTIIQQSGFEINDNKQFKEDFIHFMYTQSKL